MYKIQCTESQSPIIVTDQNLKENWTKNFSEKQARARIFTFKEVSYVPGSQTWDYIQKSKFFPYSSTKQFFFFFLKNNGLK